MTMTETDLFHLMDGVDHPVGGWIIARFNGEDMTVACNEEGCYLVFSSRQSVLDAIALADWQDDGWAPAQLTDD